MVISLLLYSRDFEPSEFLRHSSGARSDRMSVEKRDWRELCEAASKEQDPEKLKAIISELIKVLDERKRIQQPAEPQAARPSQIRR